MLTITQIGDLVLGSDYTAGFLPDAVPGLPGVEVVAAARTGAWPLAASIRRGAVRRTLRITVVGDPVADLVPALIQALSPESGAPITIQADDAGNAVQLLAICEALQPAGEQAYPARAYVATLVLDGDPRWRSVGESSATWSVTASGDTTTITNGGDDDAYPVLEITPTVGKGGYTYRRWTSVIWRSDNAAQGYPVALTLDTATPIAAGKMQADGDDLRVLVDGAEVDRWIEGINTSATLVWVLMDFQPRAALTLVGAIAAADTVTDLRLIGDLSSLPQSGLVQIDDEVFAYGSVDADAGELMEVVRAAKGTAAADHADGATAHWVQHDVMIVYGDASASAPEVDDRRKPAFDTASSSNTAWVYAQFGDSDGMRAARWGRWGALSLSGWYGCYSETERGGVGSPYEVAGAWIDAGLSPAGWYLAHPCGIVGVAVTGGKARWQGEQTGGAEVRAWYRQADWWTALYEVPFPATDGAWGAWSYTSGTLAQADRVALWMVGYAQDVEMDGITLTLDAGETPLVSVGAEDANYDLRATITNETTGEEISLALAMTVGTTLTVDTEARTVIWEADGSRQLGALEVPREQRHWLRLAPGDNVLRFDDTGTAGVTVVVRWTERWHR